MSTVVTLPDDLMREVELQASREGSNPSDFVAALVRKCLALPAATGLPTDEATLAQRRALTQRFVSGELGVELAGYEEARAADRRKSAERAQAWRD